MEDGVTENESLVFPMNNTSSGRGDEEERDQGQDRDEESKGGGGEQEGINEGQAEDLEVKDEGKSNFGSKEDLGGGGIVSHLISNIFPHGEGGGGEKEDNEEVVERKEQVKREEEGGGGGVIDNIVSRFPTPLAYDAAPATEEASLLIHAIVHD
ncbi:hypothetical protein F0562_015211 [Nyssa sinensis]|uniref:Uncharacterized protein n=1 Tax=Nyssa sinensis TaxID=561372 RepID=A0A5J4ZGR2_9ASTE|nr:hypothetical protein F0562_015211 [Nyssa sinensis]